MAASDHIANALLTEHFRYTPLTLLDDIINTVNELVFQAINAIEEGLSSTSARTLGFKPTTSSQQQAPSDEDRETALETTKQTEIENGIVQLESLLNATVDRDFDKFEIYTLRNILSVGHEGEELASWIRLKHYQGLELDGAVSDGGKMEAEEVQRLRKKLAESGKLSVALKAEEARNERLLGRLRELNGGGAGAMEGTSPFGFMAGEAVGEMRPEDLVERVKGAMQRLPEIREGLETLKTSLQTLPGAEVGISDDEATRRRYLDGQARKALRRRGVEPEASTGGGTGRGRRVGREEVEGLEAVVQALEGAGEGFAGR
ncbi:hypothetical protein MBLNU230_g7477t1 [Neophaeotheca triangularis]